VVAVLVALTGFTVLAARYAGGANPRWFDDHAREAITDVTPRTRWIHLFVQLGGPEVVVVVALVLAAGCLWAGRRRLAALAVLGPGLTGLVTTFTKPLIGRTLDGAYAYPSGHTGGATATALVLGFVLVAVLWPAPRRALALVLGAGTVGGATWTVLVVAADWHYATDALGGAAAAFAAVLGTALVLDASAGRAAVITPTVGTGRPAS
jgi:undecaprenyl-diphosphatase